MQLYLTKIIFELKNIIFKKIENVTDESEKQKKKEIFAAQNNVLTNLSELIKKRNDIINQFEEENIITKSENFLMHPKRLQRV